MDKELKIFAQTLFGEADANNLQDATAIACVIMNRVKYKNWPNTVSKVCQQKWQFSCWNGRFTKRKDDLAHLERMENAPSTSPNWWNTCVQLAEMAMNGLLADPTKVSTHYYATYVGMPTWAIGKTPVYETVFISKGLKGHKHIFFNDIDTPAPVLATPVDKPKQAEKATLAPKAEVAEIAAPENVEIVCDVNGENCKPKLINKETIKNTATVVGGGSVAAVGIGEAINQIAPSFPLAMKLLEYMPWLVAGLIVAGLVWFIWYRIQAKKK